MKRLSIVLLAAAIVSWSGCTRLSTQYGESKGVSGRTSLNGFGALVRPLNGRAFEVATLAV